MKISDYSIGHVNNFRMSQKTLVLRSFQEAAHHADWIGFESVFNTILEFKFPHAKPTSSKRCRALKPSF